MPRDFPGQTVSMLFKKLFSFKSSYAKKALKKSSLIKRMKGLTLLKSSADEVYPENKPEHGKLLIIIPKRSGNAVKRNRIKRKIKSIFYNEKLYTKVNIYSIIVYKEAMDLTFEQIKKFLTDNL
jgi:ribonuclease P protein component